MDESEVIKIENVSKKYKTEIALKNCSLILQKGRIYGVVGPNGAGKTTLFKVILGLIEPTEGNILFEGDTEIKKSDIKFGALIETPYLNSELTAYQNLRYIQIIAGNENKDKIHAVLQMVGLGDVEKKKVKKFSLGMKQRLGIAMAIINDADILILDEPMNGLDPEGIIEIREVILRLQKQQDITIVISSHILGELDKLVTDYIFIKKGEILLSDSKVNIEEKMVDNGINDFEEFYLRTIKAYE